MFEVLERRLVRVKTLSDIIGLPVSWIYRKTEEGKLPHVRAGKYLLFDVREILMTLRERGAELAKKK